VDRSSGISVVFGDWEGIRNLTGNTITTSGADSRHASRELLFRLHPIYDPANHHRGCRRQRVQNSVCRRYHTATRFDPAAVAVESYYPMPTGFRHLEQLPFPACPDTRDPTMRTLRLDYYLSAPAQGDVSRFVYDYYQLETPTYPTNGKHQPGAYSQEASKMRTQPDLHH